MLNAKLAALVVPLEVKIPKPETSAELDKFAASAVGLIFGVVSWVALGILAVALLLWLLKRNSEARAEILKWAVGAFLIYVLMQGVDVLIPAMGDVMLTPVDALKP